MMNPIKPGLIILGIIFLILSGALCVPIIFGVYSSVLPGSILGVLGILGIIGGIAFKKTVPVSGGHVEVNKPLRCPKCGDLKRETTPRYAVFICNKCGTTISIDDYIVRYDSGEKKKSVSNMSRQWKCPNCSSLFTKNPALEVLGTAEHVIGFSSKELTCPVCKTKLDYQALIAGNYDVSGGTAHPKIRTNKNIQKTKTASSTQLRFRISIHNNSNNQDFSETAYGESKDDVSTAIHERIERLGADWTIVNIKHEADLLEPQPAVVTNSETVKLDPNEQTYQSFIREAKAILNQFDPSLPLKNWLCNKTITALFSKMEPSGDLYQRSIFLGTILITIWKIQTAVNLKEQHPYRLKVEELVNSLQSQEIQKIYTDNMGVAIAMLAKDSDVDIKVTTDLGCGDSYPNRPSLPDQNGNDKTEFFRAGTQRIIIFWETVIKFPLPDFMYKLLSNKDKCKMTDQEMLDVLIRLCKAYVQDDKAAITKLEPQATLIGEDLDRYGGLEEMRRLFELLDGIRGSRTLDMHWHGIGEWRG